MLRPNYARCTTNETLVCFITSSFAKCLGVRKPAVGAGLKDGKSLGTSRLEAAVSETTKVKWIAEASAHPAEQQEKVPPAYNDFHVQEPVCSDSEVAALLWEQTTTTPPAITEPAITDITSTGAVYDHRIHSDDDVLIVSVSPIRTNLASCFYGAATIAAHLQRFLHTPTRLR
ncbi:hypothetical protein LTS18_012805 [Coniosporium uncinatum]|uniref:Uncharacterized protein n=1 Tax=Coniosporium uncinatum TaxID=93489 RepID=A0ACC3D9I5_9PEZI|nr:hypothetical protein LTS18_012805 [Coniosporium uncinatum]